jgi:hypothetical protein
MEEVTTTIQSLRDEDSIRLYLRELSRQNRHILTICPRCDKPGHAYYCVRKTGAIVLQYIHSNEMHKGNARHCWVGNIVSESEVMKEMRTGRTKKFHAQLKTIAEKKPRDPVTGQWLPEK